MWRTYRTSPRDRCKIESSRPSSDKCCKLKRANDARFLSVPSGRMGKKNCHFVWIILRQERILAWNWNFLHSQCVFCAPKAVQGLRNFRSGGQRKVCELVFQSCLRGFLARKQQSSVPGVGQFERFDVISPAVNWERTASFLFVLFCFFPLRWNFRETSTSSRADKIFTLTGITVYERWIISTPGKYIQFFLVKLLSWVSSWFSFLMVCSSLVKSAVAA